MKDSGDSARRRESRRPDLPISDQSDLLNSEQWRAVLTHFDYSEGFSFGLILLPDPTFVGPCRTGLVTHLVSLGKQLLDLSPQLPEDFKSIASPLLNANMRQNTGAVWISAVVPEFHPDYEPWFAAWREGFARLNQYRNILQRQIDCTLVFVGAAWVQAVVRTMAPDIWSVRSWVAPLVNSLPLVGDLHVVAKGGAKIASVSETPDPEFALAEADRIRGRAGHEISLARLLSRAGQGFVGTKDFQKAVEAFRESLQIGRAAGVSIQILAETELALADALRFQGSWSESKDHYEKAIDQYRAVTESAHELGVKSGLPNELALAQANDGLASALTILGDHEGALRCQQESVEIKARVLGEQHPETLLAINRLASELNEQGQITDAMALYKRLEGLCVRSDSRRILSWTYGNQALILMRQGRLDEAMALLKRSEEISLELDDRNTLSVGLGFQAQIFRDWGRLEDALALRYKQEELYRELGDDEGMKLSLWNQGLILADLKRLEEELAVLEKYEVLCIRSNDKEGLQRSYGFQGWRLNELKRYEEALTQFCKQEALCWELNDKVGLNISYAGQGWTLHDLMRYEASLAWFKKQEKVCLELGDKNSLQMSYGSQGFSLRDLGQHLEEYGAFKKQEAICLELGLRHELQQCYRNEASALRSMDRYEEALTL